MATTERGQWAILTLLHLLAFDLLLSAGRFRGKAALNGGDRVPLRSPINGDVGCLIRNVIVSHCDEFWPGLMLPSGEVKFLTFTGVTDQEIAYAKSEGTGHLMAALRTAGYYPVTDSNRKSLFMS